MKKLIILFICAFSIFLSCKQEEKSGKIISGDYVFHGDAAVLQTDTLIYGVIINEKALELNKKAEPLKKQPTDMVRVELKGIINKEKHETILWEDKLEILEILKVETLPNDDNNDVIKLSQ
ncbi:hypothetical protein E1J38_009945 [Seonamhaeicola sediminis]|uniref:NlpE C-terminal OB domain-containing protein n=1 Tax=Seonamhaeicola sediminis TaxID=2528206 RepID=A0A562YCI8_9FLAO|nr:hypothetical protein [Seonamhaeicola sediminis]TWO32139.1 hypothetical protein E1J38_009945 [Seonamhaeicola sediminis]